MTCKALMSFHEGRWRVFVAVPGLVSLWPEHRFPPGVVVPTVAERSRVVNALGFVFTNGAEWEWTEDAETPGDDTSRVLLLAATLVRPADGGDR
ncbi:DUF6303 family protein [Embleya sp. NPDC020886]|uniref:DUF6303 family protein n=1 Tax=Embleya sp. NPDC020886 TaxID=3363980 RepID=UPI003787E52F